MNNHKEVVNYVTSGIANTAYLVTVQSNLDQVLQTLVLIVGLISGILSVAYTGYKWYKQATSPDSIGGTKVTIDEIGQGLKEVKEEIDNVNKH